MGKKKKASKKKTSKKSPKGKAKGKSKGKGKAKPNTPAKPKLITMLHRRMRRTGRERFGVRVFRGFIQVPENETRKLRFLKRRGYEVVSVAELNKAREESNKQAAYLLKRRKASSLAEARRMEANRKNPGRLITERDRIAERARQSSGEFNVKLRKLTNVLQKATTKAIDNRKRAGGSQFSKGDAAAIGKAQAAIDALRAKNNPATRGQRAQAQQESRVNAEQKQVDKVRSEEGKQAEKQAAKKKKEQEAKAKKEAADKKKTEKAQADAAKEEAKTGPAARGNQAETDLTARREAEEARAERKRKAQEAADKKAKKAAEKKTSKDA